MNVTMHVKKIVSLHNCAKNVRQRDTGATHTHTHSHALTHTHTHTHTHTLTHSHTHTHTHSHTHTQSHPPPHSRMPPNRKPEPHINERRRSRLFFDCGWVLFGKRLPLLSPFPSPPSSPTAAHPAAGIGHIDRACHVFLHLALHRHLDLRHHLLRDVWRQVRRQLRLLREFHALTLLAFPGKVAGNMRGRGLKLRFLARSRALPLVCLLSTRPSLHFLLSSLLSPPSPLNSSLSSLSFSLFLSPRLSPLSPLLSPLSSLLSLFSLVSLVCLLSRLSLVSFSLLFHLSSLLSPLSSLLSLFSLVSLVCLLSLLSPLSPVAPGSTTAPAGSRSHISPLPAPSLPPLLLSRFSRFSLIAPASAAALVELGVWGVGCRV